MRFYWFKKRDIVWLTLLGILIYIFIFVFFPVRMNIRGYSMYPYLKHDDMVIINEARNINIQREDVVVFWSAALNKNLIKRVIGIPGDTVQIWEPFVAVNGAVQEQSYILRFLHEKPKIGDKIVNFKSVIK
jgi:signal peptidase I